MLEEVEGVTGVVDLMKSTGALLSGHFELASGLHSGTYIQCAKLLEHPQHAAFIGSSLAKLIRVKIGAEIDLVVSPALGGVIIGHEVARSLDCRHIFAERVGGEMTLRRGFEITGGERVVVVEDVTTTGGSIGEVLRIVSQAGGNPVGVAMIINRAQVLRYEIPIVYLVKGTIENYEPEQCPLCEAGLPLEKPGTKRTQTEA